MSDIKILSARNPNPWAINIVDSAPFQLLPLEKKDKKYIEGCLDYYEYVGLSQVKKKKKRVIKNRMLAAGILDKEDYVIGGDESHTYLNSIFLEDREFVDPLYRFFPLIPPFINIIKGDHIKRLQRPFIKCIDRQTEDEKLEVKLEQVRQILLRENAKKKQEALAKLGILPVSPEQLQSAPPEQRDSLEKMKQQYDQEMGTVEALVDAELKFKKYRHIMEEFAQLVFNKDYERFKMAELEKEALVEKLCNNELSFVIDMKEDDYDVIFVDNANSFSHQSPDIKYYSKGDYFGWFEEVTINDIISQNGKNMTEDDFKYFIEDIKNNFGDSFVQAYLTPDSFKNMPGAHMDMSKPANTNVDISRAQWNENQLISDLVSSVTTNTSNSIDSLIQNEKSRDFMLPKLFRKMTVFFATGRKVGWLVKKDRFGNIKFRGWIDENFKVTEKPIYDNSLLKENSSENLLYGEHIDWTWAKEWRKGEKISPNMSHPYWSNLDSEKKAVYLGGEPIDSPFKGKDENPFNIDPPFEGISWKLKGIRSVSFVESLSSFQILTNICFNRVPDIMFNDDGLVLWLNSNSIQNPNTPGLEQGMDPIEAARRRMKETKILATNIDREIIQQTGNSVPVVPQVLNLSRISEGKEYINMAFSLKEMAGETIGISRQRLAQSKASESATQTQQGINYSETQTEYIYDEFLVDFMPRVYQKMVEAAMYYAAKSDKMRAFYQTSSLGNAFLEVEQGENPLRHYSLVAENNASTKELMAKLEQFFFNNNTTDASMLEYIEGIAAESPSQKLEALRKAQVKREEDARIAHEREMEKIAAQEKAIKEREKSQQDHETKLKEMELASEEQQSLIRALGGLQSDNNANGQIDAIENLRSQIAGLRNKLGNNTDKLNFEKQKHLDDISLKDRELLSKQIIEQKKLAQAIANQNKNDSKSLNEKIAKKNNIA